jgi:flagellar motor switch protein FliG
MNPPRSEGYVRMPDAEFEAILARAAEEGAKRALADVGLEGDEAALDIRDLRSMLDLLRLVRRTAVQTVVRAVTTAVLLALLAGVAIKLKIFGGGP